MFDFFYFFLEFLTFSHFSLIIKVAHLPCVEGVPKDVLYLQGVFCLIPRLISDFCTDDPGPLPADGLPGDSDRPSRPARQGICFTENTKKPYKTRESGIAHNLTDSTFAFLTVTDLPVDLVMTGTAQTHQIIGAVCTTLIYRDNMMHLINGGHAALLKAPFAEGVRGGVPVTDTFP